MIRQVAIEGIDGSGKTTVAGALADLLHKEGLQTITFAPYRLANEQLGEDIYSMWRSPKSAKTATGVLRQVLNDCEAQAREEQVDVTIYDRHWMTAFTEISTDPELVDAWGDIFVPTALLRADTSVATGRVLNDQTAAWSDHASQEQYAAKYAYLAQDNFDNMLGIYRSGNDATPSVIAHAIQSDLYYRR